MTTGMQIIIAWTEEEARLVRERRTDLGETPVMEIVRVAKTCVWLNSGTEDDVAKARAYAAANGLKVYTYSQAVKNARATAAKAILRETAEAQP